MAGQESHIGHESKRVLEMVVLTNPNLHLSSRIIGQVTFSASSPNIRA